MLLVQAKTEEPDEAEKSIDEPTRRSRFCLDLLPFVFSPLLGWRRSLDARCSEVLSPMG